MLRSVLMAAICALVVGSVHGAEMRPASGPTPGEQYLLCLVNRARANPSAEAQRIGVELNEGLPRGTISNSPRQPLAINIKLLAAARAHNQWMVRQGTISHQGEDGSEAMDRVEKAGYKLTPPAGVAENLGMVGQTLSPIEQKQAVEKIHEGLYVDEGVAGRGHRVNIFRADMRESGLALGSAEVRQGGEIFHMWFMTQEFAFAKGDAFITGVVFADRIERDRFYTPGEGIQDVTITATRSDSRQFTAKTWTAGGYTLQVPPGTYRVSATGPGLPTPLDGGTVTVRDHNVAVDFVIP